MTRIELAEDYAQPARVTVGHTLLRIAIGGILIAHGVQRLLGFDAWQDELAVQFALLEPTTPAQVLIGIELAGGVGLVFGWFTRLSSLALICSVGVSVALELSHSATPNLRTFELPALLAISALYFLLAGGGPASFDEWLRARRRRKAIQNDETWLKHPYVPLPEEPSYRESRALGYGDESRVFRQSYDHEPRSFEHEQTYEREADPYEPERSYEREVESREPEQSYEREAADVHESHESYKRDRPYEDDHEESYNREPQPERDEQAELEEPPNPRVAGTTRR
jgi:putative oxidoreductase